MNLILLCRPFVCKSEEFFLPKCLLVDPAIGAFEVRVFGIRVMAGSVPMPITPVKLIDEQSTFVFHVAIDRWPSSAMSSL
jgi:hypothetical protein